MIYDYPKMEDYSGSYGRRRIGDIGGLRHPSERDAIWRTPPGTPVDPNQGMGTYQPPRPAQPSGGALRPVKHEQSETQEVPGGYRQVYGRRTPKVGQPIPKRYPSGWNGSPPITRTPLDYEETARRLPAHGPDEGAGVEALRKLPYDESRDLYREKYQR